MAVEPRLDAWLSKLHDDNGTDILLTHNSPPLLRIDGDLLPLHDVKPLTGDEIEEITRIQLKDKYGDRLHSGREVDFSFTWRDLARIRANAFYQRGTCSLSLRRIPMEIPSPAALGIPGVVAGLLRNPSGLIDTINRTRPCHIVTIEDPIEHLHVNKLAAISQREVGTDTDSFEHALR